MPTALELTREEWQPYLQAARRRQAPQALTPTERQERERLLDRVRELATVLKKRFHARRVVLFGSLAHTAWFAPDSDVDLAVEGLAPDAFWEAWRLAEEIIGDRPVDLIEIESATSSLRKAIERYGIEM
ncbi:MAG: nucleotidyltransferase domain-containing protein [Chloroflexi bacterium]|nr:nucleotidyltransferase domain-containing protein [Chloroflexota bacterium]